jgi:type I restriction enzyme, R subunit
VTIEKTFEDLMRYWCTMNDEERRALREGLDEESLAVFDLLKKPDLSPTEINRIKEIAVELLDALTSREVAHRSLAGQGSDTRCRSAGYP